jgi:methionine sulfoxide reductase heme-binding subunit
MRDRAEIHEEQHPGAARTEGLRRQNLPRFLSQGLHRNMSLLVLAFLGLHVGTMVMDTYTSIPLTAAFVPFASSYKATWLSLGAVALDLLLALVATSLIRKRLGHRAWRRVHWLAYACWPVAAGHGLGIGTDRSATWWNGPSARSSGRRGGRVPGARP